MWSLRRLSVLVGIALLLLTNNLAFAQQGGVTYYIDPLTLLFIIIIIVVGVGLAVYFFSVLRDSTNQTSLVNAQVTSINAQTNNMSNLVTSTVVALNTSVANDARLVQHQIELENRMARIYEMQAMSDINFKNTLLELLALQMGVQDIRQLMSDKVKAALAQSIKPPDVEITTTETPGEKK